MEKIGSDYTDKLRQNDFIAFLAELIDKIVDHHPLSSPVQHTNSTPEKIPLLLPSFLFFAIVPLD